jgi:hypothetical protein
LKPTEVVLRELAARGLLLKQDKTLANVVGLVTGESLRTSWWSHPKGRVIFAVLAELADHPDVLFAKLVHGKDTLVHRSLWPALHAVGAAREAWQTDGLSSAGAELLVRLDAEASVRASGKPAKELQLRLLAPAREVHTESGRHATELESWSTWAARVGCRPLRPGRSARSAGPARAGREALEAAALELGAPLTALPWPR